MISEIDKLCIAPHSTLREAIACIDRNGQGIALVINNERRLLGTISDGDVRRTLIKGLSLDLSVSSVLADKNTSLYPKPITAPLGTSSTDLLNLMQERVIRQVPLLDEHGCVAGLATWDDLLPERTLPLQAVIMAGGFGSRLKPLTDELPKPMLPVGGRPVMEFIIGQLRHSGITQVNVTTHYRPEKITEYFGDGKDFGVTIRYLEEDLPLGTAMGLPYSASFSP